jgi:hypothetical protein
VSSQGRNDIDHPTVTHPDKYVVLFEKEAVRVLDYRDQPGAKTSLLHAHPGQLR